MSATKSSSRSRIAVKALTNMYPAAAPAALPRRSGSIVTRPRRQRSHPCRTPTSSARCASGPPPWPSAPSAAPAQAASPFLRDTAICPTGKVALGGGSQVVGEGTADFHTALQESTPGTIGGGAQSLWLNADPQQRRRAAHDRPVRRLRQDARRLPGRAQGRPAARARLHPRHRHLPERQGRARRRRAGRRRRHRRLQDPHVRVRSRDDQRRRPVAVARRDEEQQPDRPHRRHLRRLRQQAGRLPGRAQGLHRQRRARSCATRRPAPRARSSSAAARASSAPARATSTPACRSSPRAPSARRPPCSSPRCATTRGHPHGRHPRRLREPDQRLPGDPQGSPTG